MWLLKSKFETQPYNCWFCVWGLNFQSTSYSMVGTIVVYISTLAKVFNWSLECLQMRQSWWSLVTLITPPSTLLTSFTHIAHQLERRIPVPLFLPMVSENKVLYIWSPNTSSLFHGSPVPTALWGCGDEKNKWSVWRNGLVILWDHEWTLSLHHRLNQDQPCRLGRGTGNIWRGLNARRWIIA